MPALPSSHPASAYAAIEHAEAWFLARTIHAFDDQDAGLLIEAARELAVHCERWGIDSSFVLSYAKAAEHTEANESRLKELLDRLRAMSIAKWQLCTPVALWDDLRLVLDGLVDLEGGRGRFRKVTANDLEWHKAAAACEGKRYTKAELVQLQHDLERRRKDSVVSFLEALRRLSDEAVRYGVDVSPLEALQSRPTPETINAAHRCLLAASAKWYAGASYDVDLTEAGGLQAQTSGHADAPRLDESSLTVVWRQKSLSFIQHRSKLLFALLARIGRYPGRRVDFDTLREKGDVWDGSRPEDTTIRGAIARLKSVLLDGGMGGLAAAISTSSFQGRPYAILDLERLTASAH